jgi:hypothetical protein
MQLRLTQEQRSEPRFNVMRTDFGPSVTFHLAMDLYTFGYVSANDQIRSQMARTVGELLSLSERRDGRHGDAGTISSILIWAIVTGCCRPFASGQWGDIPPSNEPVEFTASTEKSALTLAERLRLSMRLSVLQTKAARLHDPFHFSVAEAIWEHSDSSLKQRLLQQMVRRVNDDAEKRRAEAWENPWGQGLAGQMTYSQYVRWTREELNRVVEFPAMSFAGMPVQLDPCMPKDVAYMVSDKGIHEIANLGPPELISRDISKSVVALQQDLNRSLQDQYNRAFYGAISPIGKIEGS